MPKAIVVSYNGYDPINVGDEVMLGQTCCDNGTPDRWFISPREKEGLGGNMDSKIKYYHGWRGTSSYGRYSVSTYAYGLRRIEKIDTIKDRDTGGVIYRVTLSDDLHPELK